MLKQFLIFLIIFSNILNAQNSLEFYLQKGILNSPSLKDFENLHLINSFENDLNNSQNSAFQIYLSADYLFAPYFKNNGKLISANPDPKAIGYDAGITNGGLYSAQFNVEKNIFNGSYIQSLENQNNIQGQQHKFSYELDKHNLQKQITDQFLTAYNSMCQYNLSKEVLDNLESQLKVIGLYAENGLTTAQSYLLLKIEFRNQQTNSHNSYQQYLDDLIQLNALCGIKDTSFVSLEQTKLVILENIEQSAFIEKYSLDSLSSVSEQSVFESKYLPQLKLFMNTGLNAVELDGIQRKFGMSVGLNFFLPLYDGGQKDITRQKNIVVQKTISEYKNYSLLNLELQKHNSLSKIGSLKQRITELKEQEKEYQKIITLSEKQLQSGDFSMIEYLTLLKNFIDIKNKIIETETNYQIEINNYNYWNW